MVEKISDFKRAYALFLRGKGKYSFRRVAAKCGISKSSAHRIWHNGLTTEKSTKTSNGTPKRKPGPKARLTTRDKRLLLRTLVRMRKTNCNVTVMSLVKKAGLDPSHTHRRTFTRYLNSMGFNFLQARKKGLLSENDKVVRVKYARSMRKCLKRYPNFYTDHIAFYLDGVSFIHKYNPMKDACQTTARVWRKRGEGFAFTARGSKDLAGGRRFHLIVAIAKGKGIILKEPYEKMTGDFFAGFIRQYFNITYARAGPKFNSGRLFVMDNDPSQTSKKSMQALSDIEAQLHNNIFILVNFNIRDVLPQN
jgi:hypothetical protein